MRRLANGWPANDEEQKQIAQQKIEQQKITNHALMSELEEATPKAEAYDIFLNTEGTFNMTSVVKALGMRSAQKLAKALHNEGMIFPNVKNGRTSGWQVYSKWANRGVFVSKLVSDPRGFSYTQVRVTPSGLEAIDLNFGLELRS